jgi:hypothetical protein
MAIFNSYVSHNQRVQDPQWIFLATNFDTFGLSYREFFLKHMARSDQRRFVATKDFAKRLGGHFSGRNLSYLTDNTDSRYMYVYIHGLP